MSDFKWYDPEPYVSPDGHSQRDSTQWMFWLYRPRTQLRFEQELLENRQTRKGATK